jgi:hypothetical protein
MKNPTDKEAKARTRKLKVTHRRHCITEVEETAETILVSCGGNMGSTIEGTVNPSLRALGLPDVDGLKKMYELVWEKGSPSYSYGLLVKKTERPQ